MSAKSPTASSAIHIKADQKERKDSISSKKGDGMVSISIGARSNQPDDQKGEGDAAARDKDAPEKKQHYVIKVTYWDAPGSEQLMDKTCRLCAGVTGVIYMFDGTVAQNGRGQFVDRSHRGVSLFQLTTALRLKT